MLISSRKRDESVKLTGKVKYTSVKLKIKRKSTESTKVTCMSPSTLEMKVND